MYLNVVTGNCWLTADGGEVAGLQEALLEPVLLLEQLQQPGSRPLLVLP